MAAVFTLNPAVVVKKADVSDSFGGVWAASGCSDLRRGSMSTGHSVLPTYRLRSFTKDIARLYCIANTAKMFSNN